MTHDLLSNGETSDGANRTGKVGAPIAFCIVDIALI
jgi:hypothetical protein